MDPPFWRWILSWNLLTVRAEALSKCKREACVKVRVADDKPLIPPVAIVSLNRARVVVLETATADDAMDIIDREMTQFLFTDIQMPGQLFEVDIAHTVHQPFPDTGMVVISGRLTPTDTDPPNAQSYIYDDIARRFKALGWYSI